MSHDYEYRCNGCQELGTIVEIGYTPFIQTVSPGSANAGDIEWGDADYIYESDVQLGYACRTESCKYSSVNTGILSYDADKGTWSATEGWPITDIATVVEP